MALFGKKIKTNVKNSYIFTIDTPPGGPGESTDPDETKEFDILGFRCDHEVLKQLEPKNLSKTGIFYEFWHIWSGFLLPAALKLHGRI